MNKMLTKRHSPSNHAKLSLIVFLSFLATTVLQAPALAQANANQYFNNANGTMDNSNDQTAKDVLDRYNLRYPWNALNKRYDKLKKIDDPVAKPKAPDDNTIPEKREGFVTDGRSAPKDKDQSNTLESEKSSSPTKVLAYDSCFVMCGMPTGWFLPDAEPWKFPKASANQYICYLQPKMEAQDQVLTKRDEAIFERATGYDPPGMGRITTYGLPMSDTQYQIIDRENNQRFLELLWDPERFLWAFTGTTQIAGASAGNSLAGNAESSFDNAALGVANGYTGSGALINIANEASGTGPNLGAYYRRVSDAVKQVQMMYHQVYVPLAILFLLPGAVISQVKAQVSAGFSLNAPEARNPFEGILRSTVAVFLIPATQLIVSYAIDVGNSMAYSVYDPWVNLERIRDWTHNLSYNPPVDNVDNAILPSQNPQQAAGGNGGGFWSNFFSDPFGTLINLALEFFGFGEGLGGNTPETKTTHEHMSTLSHILQGMFNMAMLAMSTMLITLCAFQLVYMCYLFLLGPLAAAFYAWPDLQNNSSQKLFRGVFGNWVQAVITLALWRFYWMVILAIMTQRLIYLSGTKTNLQWEVAVFTCLLGLMLYVPFNPFDFDPAKAYDAVQKHANGQGGGGGGAGGGGGGPGGTGGPAQGPPLLNSMQNMINQMPDGAAKDALSSAVSATREGFDRTSYGNEVMGPYASSDPGQQPGQQQGEQGQQPGQQPGEQGQQPGQQLVSLPPGEQGLQPGTEGDASSLPPAALDSVAQVADGAESPTGTPSIQGADALVSTAGVTGEHLSGAQQNVEMLATAMLAAGVPQSEVDAFRAANTEDKHQEALTSAYSQSIASYSGGDEEEDEQPRRQVASADQDWDSDDVV